MDMKPDMIEHIKKHPMWCGAGYLVLLGVLAWLFQSWPGGFWGWLGIAWGWLRETPNGYESASTTIRNLGLLVAAPFALWFAYWRARVADRQANAAQEQVKTSQQQVETSQRQAETAEKGLLNERYQRGAEMLGSEVLSVRLGGIYALARLAQELGWTLQSFGIRANDAVAADFSSRLQGLRIAIYSLTESSSRQAKSAIEEIAPTAIVDCNADHGGTARLRALADNADLFVIAWRSAKHAATDFIRKHREYRPLLFAQGRGSSSILRAIEDHLS